LKTKHSVDGTDVVFADNNKAGKILKAAYKKIHPKNKIVFDTEMSHCYVYAKTRDEAKRFMVWMNETYFKPWCESVKDGWDKLFKEYNEAPDVLKRLFFHYANDL
jgi:hypothetical protein